MTIMQARPLRAAARLPWILALSLLAACSTPAPQPVERPAAPAGSSAYARGDYAGAAAAWQQQALEAPANEAAALRVRAADAWLLAGEAGEARQVLERVDRDTLAPADRARLDLVLADLALGENRPDEAEALLRRAQPALPTDARRRLEELQRRTAQALSLPASRDIARVAALIDSMRFYDAGRAVEILQALEYTRSNELAMRADNPRAERQLTGWLDLALTIRRKLVDPDTLEADIADWKIRHPEHLLTAEQALDTWLGYRQTFTPPRRTAVLAPDSGRLQAAGAALRDGFMSAYLAQPGGGEVVFFGTGDEPPSAVAAYFSALDAGADRIVGPLQRESVEALLNLDGLAKPVLALNDLPADYLPPPGLTGQLHGMSLSQEAEAAATAARAVAEGMLRAMILTPESAWGERMAASFEAEFLQRGGEITVATRYLESENDHSSVLERALKIDESKARKERLENTLQMPIEFEPTRRDDVDVIFLAANPVQGKLLRPQLRFLDAGDIPVFATSRIYSGEPDPARNQDLDGVRFPITRWQLEHNTSRATPAVDSLRGGVLGSLFAVGLDAWNLLPWLELMRKDPDFRFPGQSGQYRMGPDGGLVREPAWAEFAGGLPVPLPEPVAPPIDAPPRRAPANDRG